jgi:hypothetical protein
VDYCEETGTLSTVDAFRRSVDPKAGAIEHNVATVFLEVIKATLKRNHKRRITMDEVSGLGDVSIILSETFISIYRCLLSGRY